MNDPFISICIPAYRRIAYLERLLASIVEQTYSHFEVIITDDSPDDSVRALVARFDGQLPIRYFKNDPALGTPENWNEGIRQAGGEWVKVMHDDDWFATQGALQQFASAIVAHPDVDFFFSAYRNVHEAGQASGEAETEVRLSKSKQALLRRNLWYLLGENFIGNPSCTLFKKSAQAFFDPQFKWVVDFEFYIRYLTARTGFHYIDEVLINVGINPTQVTQSTFGVRKVQVPENHRLLAKYGNTHLRTLVVYDYFWRLYRNLGIRTEVEVREAGFSERLAPALNSMIRWQSAFPPALLKIGFVSKSLMFLHYLTHSSRL